MAEVHLQKNHSPPWHKESDDVYSGGSRISQRRGAYPKGGTNLLIAQISPKTARKWRKLDRGARPKFYYVDPQLVYLLELVHVLNVSVFSLSVCYQWKSTDGWTRSLFLRPPPITTPDLGEGLEEEEGPRRRLGTHHRLRWDPGRGHRALPRRYLPAIAPRDGDLRTDSLQPAGTTGNKRTSRLTIKRSD